MYLHYYLEQLDYLNMPDFLLKYLKTPTLIRLQKIGYFCGMDYASKDIYNFREYISRYDHSLITALIIYKLTKNKIKTIAGLFHDIATPCFSHVIDYMNKDYERQESTEEYTEIILKNDEYLKKCLKEDNINILDIINFKDYTIVDNERPKVCADRMDGIILTGIGWTKNINLSDIHDIVNDITVFSNEDAEEEIGFNTYSIAKKVLEINESIDLYCHSSEDNYMMELLANITRSAIKNGYISYRDLYIYDEEKLFNLFSQQSDQTFLKSIHNFKNIKKEEISKIELPEVKVRKLNPLVNNKRFHEYK